MTIALYAIGIGVLTWGTLRLDDHERAKWVRRELGERVGKNGIG